jgi:putative tricarboxylic transport membrane protein
MNLITGLAAVAIGAIYSLMAFLLPRSPFGDPMRHMIFPIIVGTGMVALGLALTISEMVKLPQAKEAVKVRLPKTLSLYGKEMVIAITASLAYAFIFERVGYVIATILYLGSILFLINGKKGAVVNVIVAVVFSVSVYTLFAYVLGVALPRMPFLDI